MHPVVAHREHRPISSKRQQHWSSDRLNDGPHEQPWLLQIRHDHVVRQESGRGCEE